MKKFIVQKGEEIKDGKSIYPEHLLLNIPRYQAFALLEHLARLLARANWDGEERQMLEFHFAGTLEDVPE
jgi:hypothetical protein